MYLNEEEEIAAIIQQPHRRLAFPSSGSTRRISSNTEINKLTGWTSDRREIGFERTSKSTDT